MQFRILGVLEVLDGERAVALGARKQRLLLAALLCRPGAAVSSGRLVDALWGDDPPASAADNVRIYVHRLRRILGAERIVGRGQPGYSIVVEPGELDARRFTDLVERGQRALASGRVAHAREQLALAIGLWRATPFADLEDEVALRDESARLQQCLLAATESRAEADLRLGRDAAVIVDLSAALGEYPYHERLRGQLMTALYHSGRQAEALELYAKIRARLVEELGTEPGERLRALHQAILRGEPVPTSTPSGIAALEEPGDSEDEDERRGAGHHPSTTATARTPIPAQLPADLAAFVGREAQLAALDAVCARTAARVAVLFGPAGVGKTSLATRWARRVADQFPDGQLHIDLGGHGAGPPASARLTLSSFVRVLGAPADGVPVDERELTALYRSLLTDRRILVVLDNAADTDVVRALLPGSGSCMAVVTSRDPLRGLHALHDAVALRVDVLSKAESVDLLRRVVGDQGACIRDDQLHEAAELCARLPLALRIAAANLADRDEQGVAAYLRDLRADRLGQLRVDGDDRTAVKAAFEASYAALPPAARELFHLLAAAPGPDLSLPAVAALAGQPSAGVQPELSRLLRSGLCDQAPGPRLRLHDLLRRFAADKAAGQPEPDAALRRLFGFYDHTTIAATAAAVQATTRLAHDPVPAGVEPLAFDDPRPAGDWLEAELANLVAVSAAAASRPPYRAAWQIADALRDYFWIRRHGPQWLDIGEHALKAAGAAGDLRAQGSMSNNLGIANWALSRYEAAVRHFRDALEVADRIGDRRAVASAASNLGGIYRETGEPAAAFDYCDQALELFARLDDPLGAANTHISLSGLAEDMGRFEEARSQAEHALAHYRRIERVDGQGAALLQISAARRHTGQFTSAIEAAEQALVLFRGIGARQGEGCALQAHAAAAIDAQRPDISAPLARAALDLAHETRNEQSQTEVLATLAEIALVNGDGHGALKTYTDAVQLAGRINLRPVELAARVGQALALCELREYQSAEQLADQSAARADAGSYPLHAAKARTVAARARFAYGDFEAGAEAARAALPVLGSAGCRLWLARALHILAEALDQAGKPGAPAHRRRARAAYAALGLASDCWGFGDDGIRREITRPAAGSSPGG